MHVATLHVLIHLWALSQCSLFRVEEIPIRRCLSPQGGNPPLGFFFVRLWLRESSHITLDWLFMQRAKEVGRRGGEERWSLVRRRRCTWFCSHQSKPHFLYSGLHTNLRLLLITFFPIFSSPSLILHPSHSYLVIKTYTTFIYSSHNFFPYFIPLLFGCRCHHHDFQSCHAHRKVCGTATEFFAPLHLDELQVLHLFALWFNKVCVQMFPSQTSRLERGKYSARESISNSIPPSPLILNWRF